MGQIVDVWSYGQITERGFRGTTGQLMVAMEGATGVRNGMEIRTAVISLLKLLQ